MKRLIIAVALVLMIANPVMASDFSHALYSGTIGISNNATIVTNGIVPFLLNSQTLISNHLLSSNFTNSAVTSVTGGDITYMPAGTTTGNNNWWVFVPTLAANTTSEDRLYIGGNTTMNSTIRYFPGTGGMTTPNSTNLTPGDNFTYEASGFINTDNGTSNKNLIYKQDAFDVFVSPSISQNITARVTTPTALAWENISTEASTEGAFVEKTYSARYVTIIRFKGNNTQEGAGDLCLHEFQVWDNLTSSWILPTTGSGWTDTSKAYDNNTSTYAYTSVVSGWTDFIYLYLPETYSTKFRFWYSDPSNRYGAVNADTYSNTKTFTSVSATGITSDNHTVRVTADTTNLTIYVDNMTSPKDSKTLGGIGVPYNTNNWTSFLNGVMPYVEYQSISINGTERQRIIWQDATVFNDLSDFNNDATPTFPTSATTGLSASLSSFGPVLQAHANASLTSQQTQIISSTILEEPSNLYADVDTSHIAGAEIINNALDTGGIPHSIFWFPLVFGFAIAGGLIVYSKTSRAGIEGSLLLQAATSGVIMVAFAMLHVVDLWGVIPFAIEAVAVIIAKKQFGW